jgi:Tfp pilus assembly protein PilN
MREIDFVPPWYSQVLWRRNLLRLQGWLVLAAVAGSMLWLYLVVRNTRSSETALDSLRGQVVQTQSQLSQMERLEQLRRQWQQQAEVLAKMGLHVDSGRLIARLAEALPPSVGLQTLNVEVEEKPVEISAAQRAALKDPALAPMDRKLRVKLQGAAPTDVEVIALMRELNKVPFFERVTPTFARDKREAGHVLREFELTFFVNLNAPSGS